KILVAGGVNARSLKKQFFASGYDVIFNSEAEKPLVAFARYLRSGEPALSSIASISFLVDGKVVTNPAIDSAADLDEYPMPSWHAMPNQHYWRISEPWGG